MDTLIKADIFFFIASIATVVLVVLVSVLLYYLIRAARNLHALSEAIKGGWKEGEEFVLELKDRLESNMIFRMLFPPASRKRLKK
ncbi:MAG: hypothetical protein V4697_01905 [Patescibacteria group bacterium]